jgi:hypothetical protein
LPLSVSFEGGHWGRREKRLIGRYLKRAHSEIGTGARHALRLVRGTAGDVRFSVADSRTGRPVAEGSAKGAASRIVQAVLDALYAVE